MKSNVDRDLKTKTKNKTKTKEMVKPEVSHLHDGAAKVSLKVRKRGCQQVDRFQVLVDREGCYDNHANDDNGNEGCYDYHANDDHGNCNYDDHDMVHGEEARKVPCPRL